MNSIWFVTFLLTSSVYKASSASVVTTNANDPDIQLILSVPYNLISDTSELDMDLAVRKRFLQIFSNKITSLAQLLFGVGGPSGTSGGTTITTSAGTPGLGLTGTGITSGTLIAIPVLINSGTSGLGLTGTGTTGLGPTGTGTTGLGPTGTGTTGIGQSGATVGGISGLGITGTGNTGTTSNGLSASIIINGVPVIPTYKTGGLQIGQTTSSSEPFFTTSPVSANKVDSANKSIAPDANSNFQEKWHHPSVVHKLEATKTVNGTTNVKYEGYGFLKRK